MGDLIRVDFRFSGNFAREQFENIEERVFELDSMRFYVRDEIVEGYNDALINYRNLSARESVCSKRGGC